MLEFIELLTLISLVLILLGSVLMSLKASVKENRLIPKIAFGALFLFLLLILALSIMQLVTEIIF